MRIYSKWLPETWCAVEGATFAQGTNVVQVDPGYFCITSKNSVALMKYRCVSSDHEGAQAVVAAHVLKLLPKSKGT